MLVLFPCVLYFASLYFSFTLETVLFSHDVIQQIRILNQSFTFNEVLLLSVKVNPFALRRAKTPKSLGHSECNKVKYP